MIGFVMGAIIAQIPLILIGSAFWPGAHGWDVVLPAIGVALIGGSIGAVLFPEG